MLIISLKLGGGGWCFVVLEKMMTQKRGEVRGVGQGGGWLPECVCVLMFSNWNSRDTDAFENP